MENKKEISGAQLLLLYEKLVASLDGVQRKGKTIPYTSVNGNMFSYFSKEGEVALRLSKADRDEFLEKFEASLMTAYGITQKEYVKVPDYLCGDEETLRAYFAKSYEYAKSLKPKATKRG